MYMYIRPKNICMCLGRFGLDHFFGIGCFYLRQFLSLAFCLGFFLNSPEHEVLKVSYYDHLMSIVCASCVVNIYVVNPLEAAALLQSS